MKNLNVKIPEGCKSVSIRVEDGKIITEFIPKGRIASYEDALEVLGEKCPEWMKEAPVNVVAYHKLVTICEALNLGHENKDRIWFPWWFSGDLPAGVAARGSNLGLAYAGSGVGFRLCSFDHDTALYFGSKPFIKLWQEYLL